MSTAANAMACTLEFKAMGPRLERLRRLADNSLKSHQLQGRVLRLAYAAEAAAEAAAEVKAVVDLERDCCRFLHFDLQEGAGGVAVTITAPGDVGQPQRGSSPSSCPPP